MDNIVECVANFSVGSNQAIILEIKNALEANSSTKVVHIHSHVGPQRSVFTIFGTKEEIGNSLLNGIGKAIKLIDMRNYKGIHPAIGVADVVPFIPIKNANLDDCKIIASKLGKDLADFYNLPTYLYGYQNSNEFKFPAPIRKKGFAGLDETLKEITPDFGPTTKHKTGGATLTGARNIMLAYNISLKTKDLKIGQKIAREIRTSGYLQNGIHVKGSLKSCQSIAWFISDFDCVQISCNLHTLEKTNILDVFKEVLNLSKKCNIEIDFSEIIGICPKSAFNGKKDANILELMKEIKLDISSFNPEKRIIENLIKSF